MGQERTSPVHLASPLYPRKRTLSVATGLSALCNLSKNASAELSAPREPRGGNHVQSNDGRSHSCRVAVAAFPKPACVCGCNTDNLSLSWGSKLIPLQLEPFKAAIKENGETAVRVEPGCRGFSAARCRPCAHQRPRSRAGEGIEAWSAGAAIACLAKELAAGIPGSKRVNSKFASSSKRNQGRATLPRDRRESEAGWARRHEQHCLAAIEMLDH